MNTHTGACHCKKVTYTVDLDISQPVIECNCSYCAMKGYLLAMVPAETVTITSGEDSLTTYRFNKLVIDHQFCTVCGIGVFGRGKGPDGSESFAINVRTIDDVDLMTLDRMPYDGKSA